MNAEFVLRDIYTYCAVFNYPANLCDYFTQDGTSVGTHIQQRFLPVGLTIPFNPSQGTIPVTHTQGLKDVAKQIGSEQHKVVTVSKICIHDYHDIGALCRAAYDSPAAEAESIISWDKLDQAEAQRFRDFLKRFGSTYSQ